MLVSAAVAGLRSIYQPGFDLIKAGVILLDLIGAEVQQTELAFEEPPAKDPQRLMMALDAINSRFGKGSVHVAATGQERVPRAWSMRQERRTPRYTTSLADVPVVRA